MRKIAFALKIISASLYLIWYVCCTISDVPVVTLQLQSPHGGAELIADGDDVILSCHISADPAAHSIEWRLNVSVVLLSGVSHLCLHSPICKIMCTFTEKVLRGDR